MSELLEMFDGMAYSPENIPGLLEQKSAISSTRISLTLLHDDMSKNTSKEGLLQATDDGMPPLMTKELSGEDSKIMFWAPSYRRRNSYP